MPRLDTNAKAPAPGLTAREVQDRIRAGAVNKTPGGLTPSVGKILRKNVFTLFNLINVSLAILLIAAGEPKNALFVGIAIFNMVLSAGQEIWAKRTLDKLTVFRQGQVTVIRDGKPQPIKPEELVKDDIMRLSAGDQIYADGQVTGTQGLEADESLLTGESDNVRKQTGDKLFSGSFITAGTGFARVTAVGADSFANALTIEAKKEKSKKSQLVRMLNTIIQVLAVVIVPVGGLLFFSQLRSGMGTADALVGAAAAMTGMIPQGLVLLTGVTLTIGAVSLTQREALVQSLYSIETLARADTLCLDKTGTITEGRLRFEGTFPAEGREEAHILKALARLAQTLPDHNSTMAAIREAIQPGTETEPLTADGMTPFSSARKWSGAHFPGEGTLIMGAPGFVFGPEAPMQAKIDALAKEGLRVLALAHSAGPLPADSTLPGGLCLMALIALSDTLRADAPETFRFLQEQGMTLKVISGDDVRAAAIAAARAGIPGADKTADMSGVPAGADFNALARENTVFGRVSPYQKRALVQALRQNGRVVCMTGDGVNDVPAMKEADCSVSMAAGSGAARSVSDFVLMSSDFSAMVPIFNEGRRVINNIEQVSVLYLVRTIYSIILACVFIFLPFPFPFDPVQMSPVSGLIVGIPTFFLALRPNTQKPKGRAADGIWENSLPAALTVVITLLALQAARIPLGLTEAEASTVSVFLTAYIGFLLLLKVARPLTAWVCGMIAGLMGLMVAYFSVPFVRDLFELGDLWAIPVPSYLQFVLASPLVFWIISAAVKWARGRKRKGL